MTKSEQSFEGVLLDTPAGSASVDVVIPLARPECVSAVEEFTRNWSALRRQLERPLFAYYWSTLVGASESGPRISSQDEIWRYVSIGEIRPELSDSGDRYVRVTGGCSWEEEHGLEIQIRNGTEIIYCGTFKGRLMESPCANSWNFANSEIQLATLEQEFVDEEELEEIARASRNMY